jgi:hypothetical protein
MTGTNVELCNIGLKLLGSFSVQSIDAPITTLERNLATFYNPLRRAELRLHTWHFAKKLGTLTQLSGVTLPDDYTFVYQLPNDCLRPLRDETTEWLLMGRLLFSNMSTLKITYIYDIKDVSQFDDLFVQVLAAEIAMAACESVTQSNTKKQDCEKQRDYWLSEARRLNAFELEPQDEEADTGYSWLDGRYGYLNDAPA